MDSVGKDVFSDEMELFLRMEKRPKRLQDKAFTSIAQSIREKSLKFTEKGVDKKIYSGKMVKLSREHSMNLENDTETETQERQQVPESIQD